jgi:hypothetical protein
MCRTSVFGEQIVKSAAPSAPGNNYYMMPGTHAAVSNPPGQKQDIAPAEQSRTILPDTVPAGYVSIDRGIDAKKMYIMSAK